MTRFISLAAALLLSCHSPGPAAEPAAESSPDAPAADVVVDQPSDDSAPGDDAPEPTAARRIVAIGDVHGDIDAARAALRLAGAIDDSDRWIGEDLVVVQVGDQLDRGDDEQAILDLFEELRDEAAAAGGEFHPLLGNHEVMNVQLDLRYVTEGGFEDFADTPYDPADPLISQFAPDERGRVAAFRPGGPYALLLAEHPMVLQLDGNVFVHGGLEPEFAELGIDDINADTAEWMRGEGPQPAAASGDGCPVWSRDYSADTDPMDCAALGRTLDLLGADRMIVAHTVQEEGINSACDGRVWRIDVGLSSYYGGETQVLEIIGDQVRPLSLN